MFIVSSSFLPFLSLVGNGDRCDQRTFNAWIEGETQKERENKKEREREREREKQLQDEQETLGNNIEQLLLYISMAFHSRSMPVCRFFQS